MKTPLVLGIDAGTGGCKAVAYDFAGNQVYSAYKEYKVLHPRVGWAEQDPLDWWNTTVTVVKEVVNKVGADNIESVSATSQREAFASIDSKGRVIANAIIWLDQRAGKQERWIKEKIGVQRVLEITGLPVDQMFSAVKLLWFKEEMPQKYSEINTLLFSKDFIIYMLTGIAATDYSMASRTMLLDIYRLEWSTELCEMLDIPIDILPPLKSSWEVVGEVTAEAAELTGLRKGTPVVAGGGDRPCEALGSGTVREGEVNIGTGTGTCFEAPVSQPKPDAKARIDLCVHVVPKTWEYEVVIPATGESLRWFRDQLGSWEVEEAMKKGVSVYSLMLEEASTVSPGADGVLYYPYLWGAKVPYFNPNAKGTFIGFTHAHTRAHLIRAVLEGVAYHYADAMTILRELGIRVRRITMTGGEVRGRLWNEIKAAALGSRLLIPRVTDAASLGAAVLAAIGAGCFNSFERAVNSMVRIAEEYMPDPALSSKYAELHQVYREVYRHLEGAFEVL